MRSEAEEQGEGRTLPRSNGRRRSGEREGSDSGGRRGQGSDEAVVFGWMSHQVTCWAGGVPALDMGQGLI